MEIIPYIPSIVNQSLGIVNTFMRIVISVLLAFGSILGVSTDDPITLKDAENVNLAVVALADTHIRPTGFSPYWLECGFEDIENSKIDFDSMLIVGDLSELGDAASYDILWETLEKSPIEKILLSTGNHDIRLDYENQTKLIMGKAAEYLDTTIEKPYYSYDVNGYTFIVLGSDEWAFEKAVISEEQLAFIDSELERATKDGKPAFVVCHQPLEDTHGLPEVWERGGIGAQSDEIKDILL